MLGLGIRRRLREFRRGLGPGVVRGWCPICERPATFVEEGPWLRDEFRCEGCRSIPRWRALVRVLGEQFPDWRDRAIHESSPCGPASEKLARECRHYTATHYFPGIPPGSTKDGVRCEDLQAQTFADESFDLVITSDVFEHLPEPDRAFAEVARTLRPGGAHVFTVPMYPRNETLVRAVVEGGAIRHLEPPDYHGNPIDPGGSLVFREWGRDLVDHIARSSGLTTTIIMIVDRGQGIDAEFDEVFVSRKPPRPRPA